MNIYEYLLEKKSSGELKILFAVGLPTHLATWMNYYEYHMLHPQLSFFELSLDLKTSKSTVQRALEFMNQPII